MEDSLKNKHFSRRKRKSEKMAAKGTIKEDDIDRGISCGPDEKCTSAHTESPVLTGCDSPVTELQNCSQFIEHEPSVIWESPQASPNSGYEQKPKAIDLITPPQGKCCPSKKSATSKPTRKLPGAAPLSFLTKLQDLSEQYKCNENLCSEEKEMEVNLCDGDPVLRGTAAYCVNQDTVNRQEPVLCTLLVKDDLDMFLADDDDDVIVQCTQEVEETINDSDSKNLEVRNSPLSPYNASRKSKIVQPNEIKPSSKHLASTMKFPVKLQSGKKKSDSEQSPVAKPRKARTPGSARYFKEGQFLGYASRKSPRTKKNIFESLNHQEICDESFEIALQTLVDEDYSFLDTSAGNDLDKTTEINKKGSNKKHSVHSGPTEQTAIIKMKTRHSEVKNLPNICCLTSPLKSARNERTNTKSRVGNPKKNSMDSHCSLLSDSGDAFFENVALEDDIVNETELVNVLEIVESQAVPSSPPLRCTPEEIQRKRIEAKQKLAKKKLDAKTKNSLPIVVKPKR